MQWRRKMFLYGGALDRIARVARENTWPRPLLIENTPVWALTMLLPTVSWLYQRRNER